MTLGEHFMILGATGDLTGRYLLPALAELAAAECLPGGLSIVAVAREPWDTERFRRHATERLARFADHVPEATRRALVQGLRYHSADIADPAALAPAVGDATGPVVAYLALPPALFGPAIEALGAAGLGRGSRLVIEKPFGSSLTEAQALNRLLHRLFPEESVYRMDHFLGKQTVQNVLGVRFANRIFDPVWNRRHVECVDIVWDETVALEGRAGYYDHTGALVDMVQNHLLQLLCLVAMEPPATLGHRDLRDRKVEVLRAVRRLTPDEVALQTLRARYGAGIVGTRTVPAYVDEPGIDARRSTETFCEVTVLVDNDRWAGVPFRLRTGKALAVDQRSITVRFRPVADLAFGQPEDPPCNQLVFHMGPDRLSLDLALNGAGDPFCLDAATLGLDLAPQELSAYARLLVDVLEGDPVLSIRGDEAEECWRIVEPILSGWRQGMAPLLAYPAGSLGPAGAGGAGKDSPVHRTGRRR